jgi:cell division protein FtsZ
LIQRQAHEDANIIVGLVHDSGLADEVRVTVIATGVGADEDEDRADTVLVRDRRVEPSPAFRQSRALMNDALDSPAADEIAAAKGEARRMVAPVEPPAVSQEDFAFEDVLDDDREESIDIPAYLRRWRNRAAGLRRP